MVNFSKIEAMKLWEISKSLSEIWRFLEIGWLLSEGSSYVVLCTPRVKVGMDMVEPI